MTLINKSNSSDMYLTLRLVQDETLGQLRAEVKAGLNSEFTFSLIGCRAKAKRKHIMIYYLPPAEVE